MDEARKEAAYYCRLGAFVLGPGDPNMLMSRAIQICKTWRMHFAWKLTGALGWRSR